MLKKDIVHIFKLFISWRIVLLVFFFFALKYTVLQQDYLGGGMKNYLDSPWLWSWANFDGEHYLSIAERGYRPLSYFFFPLYPVLVKYLASFSNRHLVDYLVSGLLVSHAFLLIALLGLHKLIRIDYKRKIVNLSVLLLLIFPTSFYFGSVYTESTFLALAVWSLYSARKKRWFWAGLLAGLSTATRIAGLALIPALLIEYYFAKKKEGFFQKELLFIILAPLGILLYMYYLKVVTGDPLEFFNTIGVFGEQRSTGFILFPQVFYRYVFKVLPNLNYSYFPSIFTAWLEFATACIFLILSILSFYNMRLSYAVYLTLGFIIPALSGSFSSFPRYALVLFPGFILGAIYLQKASRLVQVLVFSLLFVMLGIATAMFTRGFWVA